MEETPYVINKPEPNSRPRIMCGRSQNTVPIASTQIAIKGIVQYSTRTLEAQSQSRHLVTRHSREHTLSAVSPDR